MIAKASRSDEAALRQICLDSSEDDWVLDSLEAFLNKGTVLLASIGEEPVGFVKVDVAMDGSGWLNALRVVPSRRRKGIATALCRACEEVAVEAGSRAIRLWTDSTNVPANALFTRLSYRRIAEFTRWWTRIPPDALETPLKAPNSEEALSRIVESEIYQDSKGYVPLCLQFCNLSLALLEALVTSDRLYLDSVGAPCVLDLEVWRAFNEKIVELTVLGDNLRAQVQAAVDHGSRLRQEAMGTFLPSGETWSKMAAQAGLGRGTWGTHALLCERQITER